MNRIQHIKVVTNAPEEVKIFLRDVAELEGGFDIPAGIYNGTPSDNVQPRAKVLPEGPDLTWEDIGTVSGMKGGAGFIAGSVESRQIQVFPSDAPGIWAIAIGTRDVERIHAKCVAHGIATTPIAVTPFNGGNIRAFFVIVGGITFEFLRVEPATSDDS